jgi:hypothetical protein
VDMATAGASRLVKVEPENETSGAISFKDLRRIVEHSQLKIPAASKDMSLPIAFQGMGDSWRKTKSAFVATQTTSRKAATVTASIMGDQK